MELSLGREQITHINIEKVGTILNYSYIPENEQDARRHQEILDNLGVGDARPICPGFIRAKKRSGRAGSGCLTLPSF